MKWYSSKNDLITNNLKDFNNKLLISKDLTVINNSKQFTYFNNFYEYISFLENNKYKFFYEILFEDNNTPVFMYFDLDKILNPDTDIDIIDNYLSYCENIIYKTLQKLKEFIREFYKITNYEFIIGNNVNISISPLDINKPKLSIHLKINIIMNSVLLMKKFTFNFNNYLLSNKFTNDEDRNIYFYYKSNKNNKINYESIIDESVYSKFRSFRILYSSKISKNLPLNPIMNSSIFIKDHLINIHSENKQEIISIKLDSEDIFIIDTNFDKQYKNLSKPKNTKLIQNTIINGIINNNELNEIQNLLEKNEDIIQIIKSKPIFKHNLYISDYIYRFCIDKSCNNFCPYANKIHSSNRSYFDYCKNYNIIQYGCFDQICNQSEKLISFSVNNTFDALSKLNEIYIKNTIHCKNNLIQWNDIYNNNIMKEYPLKSLVAIGAFMGVGKTNELINGFIKKYCNNSNTKCLFITYQILLSKKYSQELEKYGFINYLDRKNESKIIDNKVIICLDSLWKVNTMNFDYIFIDEAMSVLLHFNSPLIKDINYLSLKFELLLLQAKYIYLLDTCIDNTIVYNMVKYLETKKNIKCNWIKNEFIRDTNRNSIITINNNNTYKNILEKNALDYIITNLKDGKNIVVSSSTKSFTELLKYILESEYPEIKYMVYNSSTDTLTIQKHSINPNDIWINYQCLIYSPTISAGISFTNLYFDELVSYIENSLYTPTVDNTLQQMFRVRQLKNGKMNIFINNISKYEYNDYPITEQLIEKWLEKHTADLNTYFPNDSLNISKSVNLTYNNNNILFDNTVMSYQTLKSILYNKNKSLHFYVDILSNTLIKDYNIPCKIKIFTTSKDKIDNANDIMKEYKTKLKKNIEFNENYLIDSNKFEFLCLKQIKESLTEFEKQQKYTYDVAINIWNFKSINNVSKEFFIKYIGHYSQSQNILDQYYIMLRNHELKNTLEKNKQQFLLKIKELIDENKDYNIRLLQINNKKFYEKLIQGQNLLNFINIDRIQVINRKDFNNNVDKFFESLNEEEYKQIKILYDLSHHKKYNTLKEITDYRSKLLITKKILNETFNIEIIYNKNKIKILEFNFNFWSNFYNMYNINKVEDSYLFK
jgi:hypothetical protein